MNITLTPNECAFILALLEHVPGMNVLDVDSKDEIKGIVSSITEKLHGGGGDEEGM